MNTLNLLSLLSERCSEKGQPIKMCVCPVLVYVLKIK